MKTVKAGLVMAFLLATIGRTDAGFLDRLKDAGRKTKEAASKAREDWKAREKKCSECGGTIHVGTKCASCKAKAAREAARKASESVKKTRSDVKKNWESREKKCSECGRTIHVGTICASCGAKLTRKRGGEFVDSSKQAWQKAKPELAAAQARAASRYATFQSGMKKVYSSTRENYGVALDKIRDPEVRKKATVALGAVMTVRRQFMDAKQKGVYKGLILLSSVSVSTEDGGMTLGDLAVSRLTEKYPGLRNTGMFDDPAATVAAVICTDTKYFLNDAKLLKKDGKNVSVSGAIKSSSALNSSDIIKYLKVAEAVSDVSYSLSTGEDGLEALSSVADAIDSAND